MRDVGYGSQSFSTKAIGIQLLQVLEGRDLGRREPLRKNREVFFLRGQVKTNLV